MFLRVSRIFNFSRLSLIFWSDSPTFGSIATFSRHFTKVSSTLNEMATIGNNKFIDLSNIQAFRSLEFAFINKLFRQSGYELRVAGGAVRDILMNKEPNDIDLATTATPSQMLDMFTKKGLRILNRNGEAHGTVTVRINDKVNYEITTLRIDSNPDGRHAEVTFTTDWELDASRRDLTVNSMFISVDLENSEKSTGDDNKDHPVSGKLYDFFNGYEDLTHGRIRFVGDPEERISEDYLRILRYFRFHARLAANPSDHDNATLQAIRKNCEGLRRISGERIWTEIKLIFKYNPAPSLLRYMAETGVTEACGLPAKPNLTELERVFAAGILSRHPNPATCVAAALSFADEVETLVQRIRPSKLEEAILYFVVKWRQNLATEGKILERLKREYLLSTEQSRLKPVLDEAIRYLCTSDDLDMWLAWEAPTFPLKGNMVIEKWGVKGPRLCLVLRGLRLMWVDSGCTMDEEALLSEELFQKVSQMPLAEMDEGSMLPAKRKRR